jgi:hypothetical protein
VGLALPLPPAPAPVPGPVGVRPGVGDEPDEVDEGELRVRVDASGEINAEKRF